MFKPFRGLSGPGIRLGRTMYTLPHFACNRQSAISSVDLLPTSENSMLIILRDCRDHTNTMCRGEARQGLYVLSNRSPLTYILSQPHQRGGATNWTPCAFVWEKQCRCRWQASSVETMDFWRTMDILVQCNIPFKTRRPESTGYSS